MKDNIDFNDVSDLYESSALESECDGNCGCVVPCPNCKGHHRHENENEPAAKERGLTTLSIS